MEFERESLPKWAWLLVGLFAMSIVANVVNALVLGPAGLPEEYYVVTVIAAMAPVLIYLGVWYDEDRRHYWERSGAWIFGDLLFVVTGAALASAAVLVVVVDTGLHRLVADLLAMVAGFLLGWGLFWWRNTDVYRDDG